LHWVFRYNTELMEEKLKLMIEGLDKVQSIPHGTTCIYDLGNSYMCSVINIGDTNQITVNENGNVIWKKTFN